MIKLYSYFRSSASYRVRIALNLKKLEYEYSAVSLLKGQQRNEEFRSINPMAHVPAVYFDGFLISESMAIMDYLESFNPNPPLFGKSPKERALILQICEIVNSGIQPLQNLKVNRALESDFGLSKAQVERWNQKWISDGLSGLDELLKKTSKSYCVGNEVTAADCFLIPQCFAARRFGVNTQQFKKISEIEQLALNHEAFQRAHPEKQPDFVP